MSATQDFVALDWIRDEISQTLEQAQQALEAVAQTPDDTSSMRSCLTSIHQIHGTLKMVELAGPVQLAEEMETMAQALMNNTVPDVRRAQEILMQSILQMSGHLDRIHREQEDRTELVIPTVNELRVARGVERVPRPDAQDDGTEAKESGPNLTLLSSPPDNNTIKAFEEKDGSIQVQKLRRRYHQAFAAIIKRQNPKENLNLMARIFANLEKLCGRSPVGYLSQVVVAVVEAIAIGGIKFETRVLNALKQVDKELKRLAEGGIAALNDPVSEEIGAALVEYVFRSTRETSRIKVLRQLYRSDASAPEEPGYVSSGPDDETLATVARILNDELTSIIDKLDLYVRSSDRNQKDLIELLPMLEQISGTMSVVGLATHQENIEQQVQVIRSIGESGEVPDEETLLNVAGALLHIESLLRSMSGDGDDSDSNDFGDLDQAQASVIRETRNGLAGCRDAIVEFMSSSWDQSKIEELPQDLKVLRGGLQICNQERAADVLLACAHYIDDKLLKGEHSPDLSEMDDLADAITSIDYYLERLIESSSDPYLQMIEVAEAAIKKLGLDVDQVAADARAGLIEAEPKEEEITDEVTEAVPLLEDEVTTEPEGDDQPPGSDEAAMPDEASPPEEDDESPDQEVLAVDVGTDVDDEVAEIFIEEVDEVLSTINEQFPRWRDDTGNIEALGEIRRAFHTLKGSGRMVGATAMGELAWSVENLLNKVLDNTVEPGPEAVTLVSEVINKIPEGVDAFKRGAQEDLDVDDLVKRADALGTQETGKTEYAETELIEDAISEDMELDEMELQEVEDVQETGEPEEADTAEDPELDEIFVSEARDSLHNVKLFIEQPAHVEWDVVASFHTLKGSAAMAGIDTVARVAAPLETLAGHVRDQGGTPDDDFVRLVEQGVRVIDQVLSDLGNFRQTHPDLDEFAQSAQSLLNRKDEVAHKYRFDFEEIRELSNSADILDTWDVSRIETIVAELRQIKEQAETLDYQDLLNLAESMLAVYEHLESQPDPEVTKTLRLTHESLLLVLDQIASGQDITPVPEVLDQLNDVYAGIVETGKEEQYFLEDCRDGIRNLDAAIQNWRSDQNNLKPLEDIGQHLSLLKTTAESREAGGLTTLLDEMVSLCEALKSGQLSPREADVDLFEIGTQALIEQLEQIKQHNSAEPRQDLLSQYRRRIEGTSDADTDIEETAERTEQPDSAQEPAEAGVVELPEDQVDEDVLPIFMEEAEELLESIDQSIVDWSNDTGSSEHLDYLLRYLHTLKGSSRLAGLASLGEYTHNFETWLIGIQQNPPSLNDQFFSLLNQRQDEIIRRIEIYKKLAAGNASEDELASLRTAVEPGAAATTPAAPVADEPDGDTVEEAAEAEQSEAGGDEAEAASEPAKVVQSQEVVRVSADLLDDLISLVGESSITRGRVEQQISDFGEALGEMEQTIYRIRDQVRRLEIETETRQSLYRTQSDGDGDSPFDELEMDRYTVLQEISRVLSESASDMLDLKDTLTNKSRDAETLLHQQARISSELQEGLTRTTMVPFARLIPRLRRIVRQMSNETGKSVRFDAYNVEGELDRTVLERIVAPLEHMLRNAVDHGIESKEERKAANKPETGRISLKLSREGAFVVLNISDDGAGINVESLKSKAIERGLMTEDSELSDHDVMQFIMHAGLSTAKKVTQISGRGVGMDVVDSELKQLGGSLTIDSTWGVGTEFTVRLPFTVSINRALMVVVGEESYAIPLNTIEGIVRVSPYELEAYYQPDAPIFEYAGQPYKLSYMGKLLNKSEVPNLTGQLSPLPVLLARSGDNTVALQVDQVIGSREVVVKALGPRFNDVPGVSGATVLGDGSVVVILDVMALVRSEASVLKVKAPVEMPQPEIAVRTVMIVDDSVTVRKVTSRLMERQGWEVTTAKDGVEAVNYLQDMYPDVMLLDIEMPRMDGFEVLRTIRRDERLKDLPVIMITSRTGEKHKQQAMELGVNSYLGKPFQEANLLKTIEEVLAG